MTRESIVDLTVVPRIVRVLASRFVSVVIGRKVTLLDGLTRPIGLVPLQRQSRSASGALGRFLRGLMSRKWLCCGLQRCVCRQTRLSGLFRCLLWHLSWSLLSGVSGALQVL